MLSHNQSIATGIVLDAFKIFQVTPIYKSGGVTDTGNYRPIATLSPFAKVLERLIYNQLYAFFEKHNILYKYQYGFRKGFAIEQATLEITDSLNMAIEAPAFGTVSNCTLYKRVIFHHAFY